MESRLTWRRGRMTSSIGRLRMLTVAATVSMTLGACGSGVPLPCNDRVRCERLVEQLVGLHDHLLLDDEQRCHCSADVDAHDVLDPVAAGGARPHHARHEPQGRGPDVRRRQRERGSGRDPSNARRGARVRWTVDTLGWEVTSGGSPSPPSSPVVSAARPGEIVLMHVGAHPTDHSTLDADALPGVIRSCVRGYAFVTLSEVIGPRHDESRARPSRTHFGRNRHDFLKRA